jgi:hypothetical protein
LAGILLGFLFRDGDLELANSGKPYAIYKLAASKVLKKESDVPVQISSTSVEISSKEKIEITPLVSENIEALKVLLKDKEQIQQLKQKAQREVLIAREALKIAETEYERLENAEKQLDTELEKFRNLYQALNGVFG